MATNLREELKARKQAYVQDEIISAAARLFAERGIRAVTIDDIASSLGYTKSVVYYYFKNKNQVLWEIFNRIHEAWLADMQVIVAQDIPPDQKLAALIRQHALNVMDRTEWTAIFFRDQSELTEAQQATVAERKRTFDRNFRDTYTAGRQGRDVQGHPRRGDLQRHRRHVQPDPRLVQEGQGPVGGRHRRPLHQHHP
jgi:AcrR family transcriptional regulator